MTFEAYARLGWWAKRRPGVLASVWRYFGREWAVLGRQRQSELCHRLADHYEQPWWVQVLTAGDECVLRRELARLRETRA